MSAEPQAPGGDGQPIAAHRVGFGRAASGAFELTVDGAVVLSIGAADARWLADAIEAELGSALFRTKRKEA